MRTELCEYCLLVSNHLGVSSVTYLQALCVLKLKVSSPHISVDQCVHAKDL